MRASEVEAWALQIIRCVESGQPVEDTRVELKAQWPNEPNDAARRIGGHANAARGEPIIWLIGVDEDRGVVGAAPIEVRDWYAAIERQFDRMAPSMRAFAVPAPGATTATVMALLFETDQAPFLVRNRVHGHRGGGPVVWEVPWREQASTRTATRADLLQLLVPLQRLPDMEVLKGELTIYPNREPLVWYLQLTLYITPRSDARLALLFHRCAASLVVASGVRPLLANDLRLWPPSTRIQGGIERSDSVTIQGGSSEVIITGPGTLFLGAQFRSDDLEFNLASRTVEATITLHPLDADAAVIRRVRFAEMQADRHNFPNSPRRRWEVVAGDGVPL